MLLPLTASADAVEINGIYYNLVNKNQTAEVTSNPNKYSGNIVIPEKVTYDGTEYDVTSIGESAFISCYSLTSVSLPLSVTSIGENGFLGSGLKSIFIPSSITTIGANAFLSCTQMTAVFIDDLRAWLTIDFGASSNPLISAKHLFLNGEEIKNLVIPSDVSDIKRYTFDGCAGLESITISSGITSIGACAFQACTGVTSISIPNTVTTISGHAFDNCSSITSIEIPNSVTKINWHCFENCQQLKTLILGKGIQEIDAWAFAECHELTDVYCYRKTVPNANTRCFENSGIEYATLHVPNSAIDNYGAKVPWKNFKEIVKIDMPKHRLTYMVDNIEYKSCEIEEDEAITPEPAPTKEGYTFSGWSEIPEMMPDHDVTITGTFTINKYKLTYKVDGEVYKTYDVEYGTTITPEPAPTKEGYTFSGWSDIPTTMPAKDVTITGTFAVNKYKLTYKVDGEVYKTYDVEYGATITPEPAPTKEGYTFSGWSDIPTTMPAKDVTVTGTFTQETGIDQIMVNENGKAMIFTIDGKRVDNTKKGLNVIRMKDGVTRKVMMK